MTNKEAIAVLNESKRQNEVMRDNPTTFWKSTDMESGIANAEKRINALDIAIGVLCKSQIGDPMTLEQLRGMDGQPVWVKVIGKTGIHCDGWCEAEIREKDPFAYVWWPGSEVEDIAKIEDYGKTWACYAYPQAHIDREAWEPCAKCVGCGNCYYFLYDDDEYPCNKCLKESTDKNQYPKFEPIGFCKHCGRPLTDEAVQRVMERLEELHEDNGCS